MPSVCEYSLHLIDKSARRYDTMVPSSSSKSMHLKELKITIHAVGITKYRRMMYLGDCSEYRVMSA